MGIGPAHGEPRGRQRPAQRPPILPNGAIRAARTSLSARSRVRVVVAHVGSAAGGGSVAGPRTLGRECRGIVVCPLVSFTHQVHFLASRPERRSVLLNGLTLSVCLSLISFSVAGSAGEGLGVPEASSLARLLETLRFSRCRSSPSKGQHRCSADIIPPVRPPRARRDGESTPYRPLLYRRACMEAHGGIGFPRQVSAATPELGPYRTRHWRMPQRVWATRHAGTFAAVYAARYDFKTRSCDASYDDTHVA